jgi:hypothetical protein
LLSQKYKDIFEEIHKLAEFDGNFKNLRSELKKNSNTPCVPHIGIYLSDLMKIEENNKDLINDSSLINFQKSRLLYDVIKNLKSYQNKKYEIIVNS